MRGVIIGLAGVFCVCASANAEERFVYKGVFDIPLLEGSFVPEDCITGTPHADVADQLAENFVCVAIPYVHEAEEKDGPSERDYVRALNAAGWAFAGGAGNAYFLEKAADAECSRKLFMVGVIQGDPGEVAKWGRSGEKDMDWSKIENELYLFIEAPETVCGDDRGVE